MTAIFARSLLRVGDDEPVLDGGSSTSDSVTTWSGTAPITRASPPSHGIAKSSGRDVAGCARCA